MTVPVVKRTVIPAQEQFQSGEEECSRATDELRETQSQSSSTRGNGVPSLSSLPSSRSKDGPLGRPTWTGPPHQNSQGFEPFSMIIPSADISCTIVVIS